MKLSKIIENCLIILFFLVVMAFPWTASFLGIQNNLSGAEEKVELKFDTLDDYIIQNFPGRELLVRTKNQLLYSLLDVSPNESITKIGDTLLSTETLNYYFHGLHLVEVEKVDSFIDKLNKLNDICKEKNKKLVIITTPTKPRYYDGRLPFADDVILAYQEDYGRKGYEILRDKLNDSDLNYFDCIKYIDSNRDKIMSNDVPLFYDSGHHWSNYKGNLVGLGLEDYFRNKIKIKMPKLIVTASPSDVPVYPDADLFNILNIYDKPNEKFYSSNVSFDNYDNDDLNFLIQGGSFLGGLLFPYTTIGMNNKVLHIENKACIYNGYKENLSFESYDDLDKKIDLLNQLKDFNVIVFEINELNVYNATFGFLDYLLENEEKL